MKLLNAKIILVNFVISFLAMKRFRKVGALGCSAMLSTKLINDEIISKRDYNWDYMDDIINKNKENSLFVGEENENINIYGLIENSLRYARCHNLANILDKGEPIYANNDNINTRRKGYVSIFVQVSAI